MLRPRAPSTATRWWSTRRRSRASPAQAWLSVYSATKAGVIGYTQAMNQELNDDGIKSRGAVPGLRRDPDDRVRQRARQGGGHDPDRPTSPRPCGSCCACRRTASCRRSSSSARASRSEIAQAPVCDAFDASVAQYTVEQGLHDLTASTPGTRPAVAALRARLERVEREAAARQRQLERYAADLREIFKQERARAQELRRSYVATVRALSNAVEARDAYTGKHAERVAAYGMALGRAVGLDVESRRSSSASCCTTSARSRVPDAILFKTGKLDRGGVRADRAPPRRSARRSCATSTSSARALRRAPPPRALGRRRLPGRSARRGDPARGARVRGRRRARRAHHRPPVSPRGRLRARPARRSPAARARSSIPASSPPTTRSPTRSSRV